MTGRPIAELFRLILSSRFTEWLHSTPRYSHIDPAKTLVEQFEAWLDESETSGG